MADEVWTNTSGGDWTTAADWRPIAVPGTADGATITVPGTYDVTIASNETAYAGSVILDNPDATLDVESFGVWNVQQGLTVQAGTLYVPGTIENATLVPAGGSIAIGGELDNVTLQGTLSVLNIQGPGTPVISPPGPVDVFVVNGLQGVQADGQTSVLDLDGIDLTVNTETLDNVAVNLNGVAVRGFGGATLTAGARLVIDQQAGSSVLGGDASGELAVIANGAIDVSGGTLDVNTVSFVNRGTINILSKLILNTGTYGGGFGVSFVNGAGTFANAGVIQMGSASVLDLQIPTTPEALGSITGSSGTLEIDGPTPPNPAGFPQGQIGLLQLEGGTLDISAGAAFSAVVLNGFLDNGTIRSDGSPLYIGADGSLEQITVDGTLDLVSEFPTLATSLSITGGLLGAAANPAANTVVVDTTSLDLVFAGTGTINTLDDLTLELSGSGAGDTIQEPLNSTLALGANGTLDSSQATGTIYFGTLVNGGAINITAGQMLFDGYLLVNDGTLTLSHGAVLNGPITPGGSPVTFDNNGLISVSNDTFAPNTLSNSGTIALSDGAVAVLNAIGGAVDFADGTDTLELGSFSGTVGYFQPGDTIDLTDLPFDPAMQVSLQNGALVVTDNGATVDTLAAANTVASVFAARQDAYGGTDVVAMPCFAQGTRLLTDRGEMAVERLAPGDRVVTAAGSAGLRPVKWIGHCTVDCRRHPRPERVWPIRVVAGAFGGGLPCRDLLLSPDHAVHAEGVLIQIKYLVNGVTIAQEPMPRVQYFHVELDRHDILLAEGLPAESYLDTGNRAAFANGSGHRLLHPDFAARTWDDASAPLCFAGPPVAAVRHRLREELERRGYRPTDAADLHVLAAGRTIRPAVVNGRLHRFLLPENARSGAIVSRGGIPPAFDPLSDDLRRLGVAVLGIAVDERPIGLDDPALGRGFHAIEQRAGGCWRWTDGAGQLAIDRPPARRGAFVLDLLIGAAMPGWGIDASLLPADGASERTQRVPSRQLA